MAVAQARDQIAEPDRFLCQAVAVARCCVPERAVAGEQRVDRLKNEVEPLGIRVGAGNLKGNVRVANFLLRADQALHHRCRRNEEQSRDRARIQPEDDLQHKRCANILFDSGMRAGEK